MEVKPFQIWKRRDNPNAAWRQVKVINVALDAVELQFLDMPNAPDLAKTFTTSWARMKEDKARYRFVRDAFVVSGPNQTPSGT